MFVRENGCVVESNVKEKELVMRRMVLFLCGAWQGFFLLEGVTET